MAKIKTAEHIQDIRGKSGNHVYSNWRGRSYLRSKAINPSNPRSSAQATLWSSMPRFSRLWSKTLTDVQRALWNEYAQREGKIKGSRSMARQIIPPPGVLGSGFNMFVRNNILLQTAGIQVPPAYLAVPPTPAVPAPSSPLGLTAAWNYGWDTYYEEDLEDELNGSTPNQWTPPWLWNPGLPANAIRVTNLISHGGAKSIQRLYPSVPGGWAGLIEPALSVDGIYFDSYVRITQNNLSIPVYHIYDWPATAYAATLYFDLAGQWRYRDGLVWKLWGAYVANTWYRVRIVLFNSTKKWEFYIDDMVTPAVANIAFVNNVVPGMVQIQVGAGAGSIYFDDLLIRKPVTTGLALTWTDPIDASVGSRIRVWLRSYGMSAHLQQVADVALGEEAYILSQVRAAQGKTVDISNLPGEYKLQLDSVSPEGRQSAPSNLISVNVP